MSFSVSSSTLATVIRPVVVVVVGRGFDMVKDLRFGDGERDVGSPRFEPGRGLSRSEPIGFTL